MLWIDANHNGRSEPGELSSIIESGIVALDLEGEFDIDTAPTILEHAKDVLAAGKNLIVNLSGATFIDSSVVQALFKADEGAKSAGRVFVLQFGTHAAVERVLSIVGHRSQASPHRTWLLAAIGRREEALAELREAAPHSTVWTLNRFVPPERSDGSPAVIPILSPLWAKPRSLAARPAASSRSVVFVGSSNITPRTPQ